MHQKVGPFIRGKALALVVFLGFVMGLPAQPANVLMEPLADWLREVEWSMPSPTARRTDSEGTRYLLYELQEHPAREEAFVRVIQLMENETGVQDSGSLTFWFDPSFQKLILHRVQIHRAGQVLDRLDPAKLKIIQPETSLARHLYTGEQKALLFVEDLRVGDALEFAYTLRGANPILAGHYSTRFIAQSSQPVDRQRFRVVWTAEKPLHHRQHLTTVLPTPTRGTHGREYVWDFADLPAIPYEDLQPAGYEPYPYLELSDFASWSDVVEWAVPLYHFPSLHLPPELQELIQQWRAAPTPEEQARRALQFVQDDLRYTGLELGPDSYQPAHPVETFQLRYGDCKGKAALYCAILRELNLEAFPALVNTYARSAVTRRLPSPFAFNHVIVGVVLDGATVWVDPTRSHQGGPLPERYVPNYGAVLRIQSGVTALEELPTPHTNHSLVRATSTYQMASYDAPVDFTVTTDYHGAEADDLRESLARNNLQEKAQDYLNFYSRYYPDLAALHPLEVSDDRERNILRLSERYQIRNVWETNNSSRRLEAFFPAENMHNIVAIPTTRIRTTPLRVAHPRVREQEIIVHLPEDTWNISAETLTVDHEAFSFRYTRTFSDRTVGFHYRCETKLDQIAPDQVSGFIKKVAEMDDLLGDTLFRPDDRSQPLLARLNWIMILLGCFMAAGATIAAVWGWHATRVSPELRPPPLPPTDENARLQGLSGWLILVGIGLCASPIWQFNFLIQNWESYLDQEVWQSVATAPGEHYHPLYGPLLVFEFLFNILFMVATFFVIGLFFGRRAVFPRVYILFMFANAGFLLADELLGAQIPFVQENSDPKGIRDIGRAFFHAFIWSAYMLKSRRVKLTFVR